MENIVCNLNVKDIATSDRAVLEHVLGIHLQSDHRLIVEVVGPSKSEAELAPAMQVAELPEWCRLYEGMTDEEIEAFERTVLTRADMTREFD
jgi:hypothetical protein